MGALAGALLTGYELMSVADRSRANQWAWPRLKWSAQASGGRVHGYFSLHQGYLVNVARMEPLRCTSSWMLIQCAHLRCTTEFWRRLRAYKWHRCSSDEARTHPSLGQGRSRRLRVRIRDREPSRHDIFNNQRDASTTCPSVDIRRPVLRVRRLLARVGVGRTQVLGCNRLQRCRH